MSSAKEEQEQHDLFSNMDKYMFGRWWKIGTAQGLTSDGQIASFLVEQYEGIQDKVDPRCTKCHGLLTLLCAKCDFFAHQDHLLDASAPVISVSTQSNSASITQTEFVGIHNGSGRTEIVENIQSLINKCSNVEPTLVEVKVEAGEIYQGLIEGRGKNENRVIDGPFKKIEQSISDKTPARNGRKRNSVHKEKPDTSVPCKHEDNSTVKIQNPCPVHAINGGEESIKADNVGPAVNAGSDQLNIDDNPLLHAATSTVNSKIRNTVNSTIRHIVNSTIRHTVNSTSGCMQKGVKGVTVNLGQMYLTDRDKSQFGGNIVRDDLQEMSDTEEADETKVHFCDPQQSEIDQTCPVASKARIKGKKRRGRTRLKTDGSTTRKVRLNPSSKTSPGLKYPNDKGPKMHSPRRKGTASRAKTCSECGSTYSTGSSLKLHMMREHTGERPCVCEVCGKAYVRLAELKRHRMQKHTSERPFACDQCQAAFTTHGALREHLKIHSGYKPNVCHICGASFIGKGSLNIHMRKHSQDRPYKCTECDSAFTQHGNLLIHMRKHTGQKPHQCLQCGVSFRQAGTLKSHLLTHTGEKPFQCPYCEKAYSTHSSLKIHRRTHTGDRPYACSTCNSAFRSHTQLVRHTRIHTGERPYVCPECGFAFARSHHLKSHMKRKHSPGVRAGCGFSSDHSVTRVKMTLPEDF